MRRILILLVALAVAGPVMAAECVQVTLRDANGLAVKSETPVVGFVLPGTLPLVNQTLPPGVRTEAGAPTPCPPDLIEAVRGVFNENCTSDKGRASAAGSYTKDNKDLVTERCQALYKALNP